MWKMSSFEFEIFHGKKYLLSTFDNDMYIFNCKYY